MGRCADLFGIKSTKYSQLFNPEIELEHAVSTLKAEAKNKSESYSLYLADEGRKSAEVKAGYSSQIDDLQEQLEITRKALIDLQKEYKNIAETSSNPRAHKTMRYDKRQTKTQV
jgi:hypothetical protein